MPLHQEEGRMSSRKLTRSLARAIADAQETAQHCGTTIWARLPILSGLGVPAEQAVNEWNRACLEKVAAAWEGAFAASAAWQAMMLSASLRPPRPAVLANEMISVVNKAVQPARRRVRANARRLTPKG
jgi:hypothetical protein